MRLVLQLVSMLSGRERSFLSRATVREQDLREREVGNDKLAFGGERICLGFEGRGGLMGIGGWRILRRR